jgi:aldehyde dehydrogenase (NAD+)
VQEGIYDEFVKAFTAISQARKLGDPFAPDTVQGPQTSKAQFDVGLPFLEFINFSRLVVVARDELH